MAEIDFSKLKVQTDESMVDEDGNPRKDVAIYEGNVAVCHPEMEEKVNEAIELFFRNPIAMSDVEQWTVRQNNEGGENE